MGCSYPVITSCFCFLCAGAALCGLGVQPLCPVPDPAASLGQRLAWSSRGWGHRGLFWLLSFETFVSRFVYLLLYVCGYFACMWGCALCAMPVEAWRGHLTPWIWSSRCLLATLWVLAIEPRTSGRAASFYLYVAAVFLFPETLTERPQKTFVGETLSHREVCACWCLSMRVQAELPSLPASTLHLCFLLCGWAVSSSAEVQPLLSCFVLIAAVPFRYQGK